MGLKVSNQIRLVGLNQVKTEVYLPYKIVLIVTCISRTPCLFKAPVSSCISVSLLFCEEINWSLHFGLYISNVFYSQKIFEIKTCIFASILDFYWA